jgi:hypothetical protein
MAKSHTGSLDTSKVQNKSLISTDHNGRLILLNPQNPDKLPQFYPFKHEMDYEVEESSKHHIKFPGEKTFNPNKEPLSSLISMDSEERFLAEVTDERG